MRKSTGSYPSEWKEIAQKVKDTANWTCIRCGHPHDPQSGHTLTVHHWDMNPANCRWWNLLALCQGCHLRIQAKVKAERPWIFEHSGWFQPYAAGYYACEYLGEGLERDEVMARLDELLELEPRAVIGRGPIAMGAK